MSRVFDVIKYGTLSPAAKPVGVPDEWPSEVIEKEDTDPVTVGAVRMTEAQFKDHTRQHLKAWRTFMATKPVFPEVTRRRNDVLLLKAYHDLALPTTAQTNAALKALIRIMASALRNT